MKREVTVVGGGLAGLYAAYSAAVNGADVELIEKSLIGTRHNCGEMFGEFYTSVPKGCRLNEINTFIVKTQRTDGTSKEVILDFMRNDSISPFVMTDKCKHELIMREKCLKEGVSIRENTQVNLHSDTRYIIDASGASHYMRNMGKAIVYITKGREDYRYYDTATFTIRKDLNGYSWVFPRGREQLNVGEGIFDIKNKAELMKLCGGILYRGGGVIPMPTMQDYIFNMQDIGVNVLDKLSIGNAAGLVNSMVAGGEHFAVLSGMLAGELVAKKRERKFVAALDEIIGDEMRFGISMYEFIRKQDMYGIERVLSSGLERRIDNKIINKTIRKAMSKWISIPEVTNSDMEGFISS